MDDLDSSCHCPMSNQHRNPRIKGKATIENESMLANNSSTQCQIPLANPSFRPFVISYSFIHPPIHPSIHPSIP
ncbi:hypothetical protein VTL71DRAFT_16339 [Oculimacula yallundae]|uniref:Uncharacterized protein n=1 Tax=Oculimacula yallundae TaxID=86028 RepID=A0ABR4CFH7_9HELO